MLYYLLSKLFNLINTNNIINTFSWKIKQYFELFIIFTLFNYNHYSISVLLSYHICIQFNVEFSRNLFLHNSHYDSIRTKFVMHKHFPQMNRIGCDMRAETHYRVVTSGLKIPESPLFLRIFIWISQNNNERTVRASRASQNNATRSAIEKCFYFGMCGDDWRSDLSSVSEHVGELTKSTGEKQHLDDSNRSTDLRWIEVDKDGGGTLIAASLRKSVEDGLTFGSV